MTRGITVILLLCLVTLINAQDPSVFSGLKGMLPPKLVAALENVRAADLQSGKKVFRDMLKSSNVSEVLVRESPRLFEVVRETVHALKAKKNEAFAKFTPATNAFITKLQGILENAIEETAALYKLEKPEVKENLREIFPRAMFIIEHPTFKSDLIELCCCCQSRHHRHHHHGGGGGGGLLGFLFG
ncbi:hypothetical protein M3Y94_01089500 [Aphelenchoides besseyi]|nr:hypothetical protein M3Y94_01089500 [Aphelenchoides besseyi]KAI6221730.1 hypothetical protein M3Y95_00992900 [Aphelenchoides besseyi]